MTHHPVLLAVTGLVGWLAASLTTALVAGRMMAVADEVELGGAPD